MATQTDAGLMVPVIRNAQSMNVWQLASEIVRLAEAARSGKAKSEELSGSTLTVTSLGPLGGIATTPVINRPEVAIIGPNRVIERPVIRNGEIVAALDKTIVLPHGRKLLDQLVENRGPYNAATDQAIALAYAGDRAGAARLLREYRRAAAAAGRA